MLTIGHCYVVTQYFSRRAYIKMNSSDKFSNDSDQKLKSIGFSEEFSVLLDKDNRIVKASPTFSRIIGLDDALLHGRQISEFIDHETQMQASSQNLLDGQKLILKSKLHLDKNSSQDIQLEISKHKDAETLLIARAARDKIGGSEMAMEELLHLFVKHSPAALAMLDNNLNYIITSDRWIKDYNLKTSDLSGKNHYDVFSGIPDRWKEIHKRCLNGAVEKSDEDYFEDNQGNLVWNRWEIHPWHKSNGEIGGILMFTEVITRAKEAEMKFSDLAKNPLVGVFILQNGQLKFANESLCKTLGFEHAELVNYPDFKNLIHPDDQEKIITPIQNGLKANSYDLHIEFRCYHKLGHTIWVELYASKTLYESKPALIGTLTDISERKQRENRTEHQIELFKELSFIISHQLRHEFVKLNGVVSLINLNKEKDAQWELLLKESLISFNKIDEYIFNLNDKLEKLNQEQMA